MIDTLSQQSKPRPFWRMLFCLGLLFLVAGCTDDAMWANAGHSASAQSLQIGPNPPLKPEAIGAGTGESRPITDMSDAISCLIGGQPVYAVMQSNANVRIAPENNACETGRASAGTLVRVEGVYLKDHSTPLASLDRRQQFATEYTLPPTDSATTAQLADPVGYIEDIQPIFERTCASCHGGVAKIQDLQVTTYAGLMAGSSQGKVVVPGNPSASKLWQQVGSGAMPLVGELAPEQKRLVMAWIAAGAPERRLPLPKDDALWLQIRSEDFSASTTTCEASEETAGFFIPASDVRIASCAAIPTTEQVASLQPVIRPAAPVASQSSGATAGTTQNAPPQTVAEASQNAEADPEVVDGEAAADATDPPETSVVASAAPGVAYSAGETRIQAGPLGLPAPSDADPWMIPRGGFCIEQRLQQRLDKNHGITSLAFAPDGRLFIALDSPSTGDIDPNILFDAFHPSRSIAVYNSVSDDEFYQTILSESSRVTGMVWHGGALYVSRAGEVGRIPDGGGYERLANGFAVNGRLFHANNGIAVADGWLYISAGGVRDGYSDGIIAPGDGDLPAETLAVNIASGGNAFASRLVRARIDRLLTERHIGVFQTAARGLRNPYGIAADPFGRLWVTDNGATNVAEEYLAGDEVNLFDPRALSPEAAAGNESATPFYGFPMHLSGMSKDWWTPPVLPLLNTTAPTGITWAYGTVYFAQYGRNAGLYRMSTSGGRTVAERVLLAWPIQSVTTAPDGAIWIGTGNGGLYRLVAGCG
jgi:glucose/arabinose dehydrogenase/mono/diheme cytochrome c family protein